MRVGEGTDREIEEKEGECGSEARNKAIDSIRH